MQQLSSFTERKGGASIIRGTYALRQLLPCVCCISSFQAKCCGCLNGIFDPFWTFLIIYFCFRKEESQLHSLSYIEVPEEAFEEEIVAKDSVVNIFVNKRFAKLHESLLDARNLPVAQVALHREPQVSRNCGICWALLTV